MRAGVANDAKLTRRRSVLGEVVEVDDIGRADGSDDDFVRHLQAVAESDRIDILQRWFVGDRDGEGDVQFAADADLFGREDG